MHDREVDGTTWLSGLTLVKPALYSIPQIVLSHHTTS